MGSIEERLKYGEERLNGVEDKLKGVEDNLNYVLEEIRRNRSNVEVQRPNVEVQRPNVEVQRPNIDEGFDYEAFVPKPVLQIICGAIVVLFLAWFAFQYVEMKNCPEKVLLANTQTSLGQCESKLKDIDSDLQSIRDQNTRFSKNIKDISSERAELERRVKEAENEATSSKAELELAKQQVSELQEGKKILTEEKEKVSKELSDTKYSLGACKNKNMDHEVRSLELLQEIEGLKKELKAC